MIYIYVCIHACIVYCGVFAVPLQCILGDWASSSSSNISYRIVPGRAVFAQY